MFTLKVDEGAPDLRALTANYRRTAVPAWLIKLAPQAEAVLQTLESKARDLKDTAAQFRAIGRQLGDAGLSTAARMKMGREGAPGLSGWVRKAADGLSSLPALQKELAIDGAYFSRLVACEGPLRALVDVAGQAKDRAMDLRALNAGWGWFQVCTVLDTLREELPHLDRATQQRVLGAFAPMLSLISLAQAEEAAGRAKVSGIRKEAAAAAEEAVGAARREETRTQVTAGKEVAREDLLELAREAAAASPAPTAPGDKKGGKRQLSRAKGG